MTKKQIKLTTKIFLLIGTIVTLFFVPWPLVKAWIKPLPNTVQEQVDEAVSSGFDGVVVYVDRAGKSPEYFTSGWHNKELQIKAKPQALFKIASISKLYDAVALVKLVNDGTLSLDKTIVDYLPELKGRIAFAEKISLRLLVQHRSGIPNFTAVGDYWAEPKSTYKENLALILDKPANFEPDKDYEYCNTNFLLINKIMDEVLGYSNFQFIEENILKPLNLNHTYASVRDVDKNELMSGYHEGYPLDLKNDDVGMVASAADVGVFLRAINEGAIFGPNEKSIYDSLYRYEHDGWVPGYQSFAKYNKELNAVIVAFYSTTDPDLYKWNLAQIINNRIVDILKE